MRTNQVPGLLRAVSRWELVALSLSDVIGSGVYLLPAAAALYLGTASPWAVLAAGVAVSLLVLCFAEAASLFDRPGSAYVYARAAFGEFVGFEVGWMTWLSRIASVATLSVGFAQALGYFWPGALLGIGRGLVITLPLLLLTWINIVGVKSGARTAVTLAIAKIVPLLLLIAFGIVGMSWSRVFPIALPTREGLGRAALLILFAYGGFENTAAAAGEFRNPRRDVPFALLMQIALVTAIYTAIQLVVIGTLSNAGASRTPLADAASLLMGSAGAMILTLGAALSILGTNSNIVFSGPRYLYALAESQRLPPVFARIHQRYRTPYVAIITQTALTVPVALSGTFTGLAALSVLARFAAYISTALAVPVLRRKLPTTPRTVRLPGGPTIPAAAVLVCLLFVLSATVANLITTAIALAAGAVMFASHRRSAPYRTWN